MSEVVTKETDFLANPTAALALPANPNRAYLEIQNKDVGTITYKLGSPFIEPVSAVQKITFDRVPTGGTWTITFPSGVPQTTSALAYNADAAAITTALEALPNIGANNIDVSGDYTAGFTLTFQGNLANMPQPAVTANTTGLTDDSVQSNAVQAIAFSQPPVSGTFKLSFKGDQTEDLPFDITADALKTALNALDHIAGGVSLLTQDGTSKDFSITMGSAPLADAEQPLIVVVSSTLKGADALASAVYVIRAATQPVAGTFIVSDGTYSTDPLPYDVDAATLQAALEAFASIGAGNVAVSGVNFLGGLTVTFQGALANTDVPDLILKPANFGDMDEALVQGDTLNEGDEGLDDLDPDSTHLVITRTTEGHGTDDIATTISTTVAGGAPAVVQNTVVNEVTGVLPTDDGVDILANGGKLWDTEVPTGDLYIKSANSNAAVVLIEG